MTDERLAALDRRVTALEKRDAVDEVHHQNTMTRLSSIEDTLKWLSRLIIGGMLMALIGFVVSGGIAP